MFKRTVKRALEYAAAYGGWHRRTPTEPTLLILGYHRVLPSTHPEFYAVQPGMRVRPETLRMHICELKKHFDIIDINQWVEAAKRGRNLPRKSVALTFDDGWVDNYEYAFPILKEESVPATIFLVSSLIGTSQHFWPERVIRLLDKAASSGSSEAKAFYGWLESIVGIDVGKHVLCEEFKDDVISCLKRLSDEQIIDQLRQLSFLENSLSSSQQLMDLQQLKEMSGSGLVSFGAHTRHHHRLVKISDDDLLYDEVVNSRSELEKILGIDVLGFCYPNGDYNDKSVALVKDSYEFSCTTRKGLNHPEGNYTLMNRVLLHEDISDDPISFGARVAGFL